MSKVRLSSLQPTNISFELALEEFIDLLQAKGRSVTTVNDYQWHCTRFHILYPHFPKVDQMKQGASAYLNAKISPYTYNLRLTYNKCFFRYCVEQGYLLENPMQLFKVKKTEPRIVQHSSDVLIKLLQQPDTKTYVLLPMSRTRNGSKQVFPLS
jgi:integrase/recombinase XerD